MSDETPPGTSPLDVERQRLRAQGYNDTEISQILVSRALGDGAAPTGAPPHPQGVLSNVLSSVVAVAGYAGGLFTTIRHDVATILDRSAPATARTGAFVAVAIKAVVIGVLVFAGWQEWQQHIIAATAIADSQARKIRAEECSARMKAAIDTMPMDQLMNGGADSIQKDCDPTYAARAKACDDKFQTVLATIETLDLKDKDPGTTIKTSIEKYKSECTVTNAQQAAATTAFEKRNDKIEKIKAALADFKKSQAAAPAPAASATPMNQANLSPVEKVQGSPVQAWQIAEAGNKGDAIKAYKLARQRAAEVEANPDLSDPLNASEAFTSLAWRALFAREFSVALDASERSIKLRPRDLAPLINQAHALMFLGRNEEAKSIYLKERGATVNGKPWAQVIFEDFAALRKAGITNPLMAEIEAALK